MVLHGGVQFARPATPGKKAHPANRAFSHTFLKNMQLRFAAVNFRIALPSEYGLVTMKAGTPEHPRWLDRDLARLMAGPPAHHEPAVRACVRAWASAARTLLQVHVVLEY